MPTIFVEIPDHANTIRRASMLSIVQNVLGQLDLDDEYLQFVDFDDNKSQPNTQIGEANDVKFGSETRILVEMEEQRDSFNLVDRGLGYKFELPILHDPTIGLRATPAHARHIITANMSARFRSRGAASEWINTMHRRTAMFGDVFETEATFFYVIPDAVNIVAKAMYLTGAKRVKPKETFDEYLDRVYHKNVTMTTTDTGSKNCRMMRNTYGRVNVILENLGEITADKDDQTGTFTARLSYRFMLNWPEGIKIDYPCTVNNTMIPEFLWQINELTNTVNQESYQKDDMVYAQDKFTTHREYLPLPIVMPPIGVPTFMTEHRTSTERELIVAFLSFGEEDVEEQPDLSAITDKHICNLADLSDDVVLTPSTLEYIRKSYAGDQAGGDSLIKIYVYAYQRLLTNSVRVDQNLDVWIKDVDIDLTEEYRLAITIDTSTIYLQTNGRRILSESIDFLLMYIMEFHPVLCLEYPWLFPDYVQHDNIAGGGLYPVFTVGNRNQFYPTIPPWTNEKPNPRWPNDYVNWWVDDDIINDKPIYNPDGSVDVDFNPDWPGWDDIIDNIGRSIKDPVVSPVIHLNTIIAKRNV